MPPTTEARKREKKRKGREATQLQVSTKNGAGERTGHQPLALSERRKRSAATDADSARAVVAGRENGAECALPAAASAPLREHLRRKRHSSNNTLRTGGAHAQQQHEQRTAPTFGRRHVAADATFPPPVFQWSGRIRAFREPRRAQLHWSHEIFSGCGKQGRRG